MKKQELLDIILELPANQREPDVEKAWAKEAQRRLEEFEAGRIEAIPGDQVMNELKNITGE